MTKEPQQLDQTFYITGNERRSARFPRRSGQNRRHRIRFESVVSDCRTGMARRREDEEGFIEFESLYSEKPHSSPE